MRKKLNKISNYMHEHDVIVLTTLTIIFELIMYILTPYISNAKYIILGLYVLSISLLLFDKKNIKKNIFYFIYILGVLLRTLYIIDTDIYTRQHDVGLINENGHLGYIYIIYNTLRLPITNNWQFYHPPLWHILASLWLGINELFKVNFSDALEGIQILTLLFSSLSVIVVNKICEKLKLKDRYRYLTVLFFAVHPTMLILSGSINNDVLMIFLEILIILTLVNWYNDTSIKNTIFLAVVTGLCVMSKVNGALMAMPIMYVFIDKFFMSVGKDKKKIKNFLGKILLFGIISLPIGLWHQVRNMIKFKGINAIPKPGEWLYVGDIPLVDRFFKINFHELFNYADVRNDYNLPSYIIKSSIFGEYSFDNIDILKIILISLNLILIIISIIFIIRYLVKNNSNVIINSLIITWITSVISMYIFNYNYPYACSMDFRYIVITLVPGIMIISYSLNEIKRKAIRLPIEIICISFIISSVILGFMI